MKYKVSFRPRAEDGTREFYAECNDVPIERCYQFVREVVPLLFGRHPEADCDFLGMRDRLHCFLKTVSETAMVAATPGEISICWAGSRESHGWKSSIRPG